MPKVVTQSGYESARADFQSHYFLDQCGTEFGGQDIQIPWIDFAGAVADFMAKNKLVDPNIVALRFVHCFNAANSCLYLRLQICTMTQRPNSNIYDINATPSAWHVITDGNIATTTNTELSDSNYLNNLYYCDETECSPSTLTKLADDGGDLFARNLVLPWGLQVSQLYPDNSNPQGAKICFGACSFPNTGAGAAYQHGLVIYLRDSNGTELLSDNVGSATYDYKGCDMSAICPPCCNVYIS